MGWVPSHDTIGDHPKTRRAARKAGVPVPTMVGHLHLLWHWALRVAPDGDLSRFEADDLADGAQWVGDPSVFLKALTDCGPGESEGFLEESFQLHDWAEYGGRYHARSAAGKAAAETRWEKEKAAKAARQQASDQASDANALPSQSNRTCDGNAEERRGEKRTTSSAEADGAAFDEFWQVWPRKVDKQRSRFAFTKAMHGRNAPRLEELIERVRAQIRVWDRENRQIDKIPHASTWLNGRRWEDDDLRRKPPGDDLGPQETYR